MRGDLLCGILLLIFVTPWVVRFLAGVRHSVTIKETLTNCAILCVLAMIIWFGGTYGAMWDTQILNGKVTSKQQEKVSCEHSYSCNCRTDSKGNTSCDTCYEHPWDYDWVVNTTVADVTIDRIDRRGTNEPPRFTAVKIGEFAATSKSYLNYIKAAPDSIFNLKMDMTYVIPQYPHVYDYYRFNRVINSAGYPASFVQDLNDRLNDELRTLGFSKEVNIIVNIVGKAGPEYVDQLRTAWLGGKKNDVVVVISMLNGSVHWARVFSWSKNDIFNVSLRDDIVNKGQLTSAELSGMIVRNVGQHFVRRPMQEFEYLKDDFDPPVWLVVLMFVIGLGGSVLVTIVAHRQDYFDEAFGYRYGRY